jgi:hypothetical protein
MLLVLGGLEYDGGEYPGVDCRYSSKSVKLIWQATSCHLSMCHSRVSHLVLFLFIQRGARVGTLGPGGLLGAIRSWCSVGWTVVFLVFVGFWPRRQGVGVAVCSLAFLLVCQSNEGIFSWGRWEYRVRWPVSGSEHWWFFVLRLRTSCSVWFLDCGGGILGGHVWWSRWWSMLRNPRGVECRSNVYTVVFVSRSMSGCRKKGLRAPTCAVAFLILDLTSVSSRRSVHQKLMENVPTMENAGKCVSYTKQPARYAIIPILDKHNKNLKIVWASILMMSRS